MHVFFFFSLSASLSESSSSTDRLYRARIRKRFFRETDKVSIPIFGRISIGEREITGQWDNDLSIGFSKREEN